MKFPKGTATTGFSCWNNVLLFTPNSSFVLNRYPSAMCLELSSITKEDEWAERVILSRPNRTRPSFYFVGHSSRALHWLIFHLNFHFYLFRNDESSFSSSNRKFPFWRFAQSRTLNPFYYLLRSSHSRPASQLRHPFEPAPPSFSPPVHPGARH